MARLLLKDEEWNLIADLFADYEERTGPVRPLPDPREVLDGILWILRTGAPWRDLPEEFGSWKTAWRPSLYVSSFSPMLSQQRTADL